MFSLRAYIFLSFAFGFLISFAQNKNVKDTINVTDSMGRKQGYWIIKNHNHTLKCEDTEQITEQGRYKNNKKTGIWTEFYCNGNKKSIIPFVDGKPKGHFIVYYQDGTVTEEGDWGANRRVGVYKSYYSNGQIQEHLIYNETGKRNGIQKQYFDTGIIHSIGDFIHGEGNVIILFDREGKEQSTTFKIKGLDTASAKSPEQQKKINELLEIVKIENKLHEKKKLGD